MQQEVTDSKSSAEARAERVRRLRNMANLSRQNMCNNDDIKLDTLIGWEVARHGGLSEKGAKKLIDRVYTEGVSCSLDWLLHGAGSGPTVASNFDEIREFITPLVDQDKYIRKELLFFRENNPDSVELAITDKSMSPHYAIGDFVAGIKRYQDKLQTIIGLDCIVQPADGSLMLRKLLFGDEENKYNLICTNYSDQTKHLIYSNVTIAYAAPVIWHRKRNP